MEHVLNGLVSPEIRTSICCCFPRPACAFPPCLFTCNSQMLRLYIVLFAVRVVFVAFGFLGGSFRMGSGVKSPRRTWRANPQQARPSFALRIPAKPSYQAAQHSHTLVLLMTDPTLQVCGCWLKSKPKRATINSIHKRGAHVWNVAVPLVEFKSATM